MVASYNPQLVVLGTDGTIVDADPSLYFRPSKTQLHHDIQENEHVQHFPDLDKEIPDSFEVVELPLIETPDELLEMVTFEPHTQADKDEFSSSNSLEVTLSTASLHASPLMHFCWTGSAILRIQDLVGGRRGPQYPWRFRLRYLR